jgi:GT2 family glycosyltransferase
MNQQSNFSATPDLSIIFVNYNTKELLCNCIKSILSESEVFSYEIIVVDNHSSEPAKDEITGMHSCITWVDLGYNAGFARANNAGIKLAKGRNLLLLNTDTIITDNAIGKALQFFEADKDYAACGVQLLNTDNSLQISGAHTVKGGINTLLSLPYLGDWVRFLGRTIGTKPPSIEKAEKRTDVDWIVGAFILTRKSVVEKAGLLDEDFFMYSEEIEWCARLKKQGKLCLYGEPKVVHIGGGSSKSFYKTNNWNNGKILWNKKGLQIMVSNLLRTRKEFGAVWLLLIDLFYCIEVPFFFIALLFDHLFNFKKRKFLLEHFWGYTVNILKLQTFIPRMLFNKPYFYIVK